MLAIPNVRTIHRFQGITMRIQQCGEEVPCKEIQALGALLR